MKTYKAGFVALSIGVLIAPWAASPASAADAEAAFENAVRSSAPEILLETSPELAPEVMEIGESVRVNPGNGQEKLDVPPVDGELVVPPSTEITFASGIKTTSDTGVVEVETVDPDSSAFIQPSDSGYRIISVTENSAGPDSFTYDVDVPASARLVETGALLFLEDSEHTYGVLEQPWARDADGRDVRTWFEWSGGKLTQHLDLSGVKSFPVVADPAWTYAYKFPTYKTSTRIEQLLRACFNCYFPVAGAPRQFPAYDQLLPLTVLGLNFECRMRGIARVNGLLFQYSFAATKNHIDGLGSTITFSFRSDQYLHVSASIQNQLLNNNPYRGGAIQTWSEFATRLRNA